jgi:hypothetical protein
MDRNSFGKVRLYQDVLIPRQSYHGDFVYLGSRVVVSDSDDMSFCTQVLVVRCAWAPMAMSCRVKHLMLSLPENPVLLTLIQC